MNTDPSSYWDAEADRFDEAADHGLENPVLYAAWSRLLGAAVGTAPLHIADLGCGTGTLTMLLADMGHQVDGVDFSTAMLERARAKAAGRQRVHLEVGDAADPRLAAGAYDIVLSRHVLWALPEPAEAVQRWAELLAPGGALVLIEGRWETGAGLEAVTVLDLLRSLGREAELTQLRDPALWGREIADERYMIVSRS